MILRNFLNRLLWDEDYKKIREHFAITYIHRGAPDDEKTINALEIKSVLATGFEIYSSDFQQVVKIPFHRIKYIVDLRKSEVIYRKSARTSDHSEEEI
jgi:uncharacterized protein (UPF0248 family)